MVGSYIPAIITASVALLAAIGAQFLSSWLTYRRENKKYNKEVYEKFISEYFIDVLTYARINALTSQSLKQDVDISLVLDNMFKKIQYADKHLQSLNLEYKTLKYMEDTNKYSTEIIQFKICYFFLLFSKKLFKKIGFKLEPTVKFQLIHSIKVYAFLYIYSEARDYTDAIKDIISIEKFGMKIINETSLNELHKLVCSYDVEARDEFLKNVDKEIQLFINNEYY